MTNNNASNMLMLSFFTTCAAILVGLYLSLEEKESSSENNLLSQDNSGQSLLSHNSNDNLFSCAGKGGAIATTSSLLHFFGETIQVEGSRNGCGALSRLLVCVNQRGLRYLEIFKQSTQSHISNVEHYLKRKLSAADTEESAVTCEKAFSAQTPHGTFFSTSIEGLENCVRTEEPSCTLSPPTKN